MIIFAIPLKAKKASKDWETCEKRFWETIQSIFNQKGEFKVIVACNDIPNNIDIEYDDRLEFIQVNTPIPQRWIEMARDKFWKLTVIAVRIREILELQEKPEQGIYVMPVDGDDLLNCNIAEWCSKYPHENGFVSEEGYVWEEKKQYLRIYKEMYTYCGSCNVIKMYREDLPEELPVSPKLCHDKETAEKLNAVYPIRWDYHTMREKYQKLGKTFSILPFKSTIYRIDTGDNISAVYGEENQSVNKQRSRFHPIAFLRKINIFKIKRITPKIKKEFGLTKEDN